MDFFPHTHAKQQVLQTRWRITRICLQQSHTEEHGSHQYQLMCFWNGPDDTYQFCSQQENIRCDQHRGIYTHTHTFLDPNKADTLVFQLLPVTYTTTRSRKGNNSRFFCCCRFLLFQWVYKAVQRDDQHQSSTTQPTDHIEQQAANHQGN